MLKSSFFIAALLPAMTVSAALELALPMESRPGPARSIVDAAVRGFNGRVRLQKSPSGDAQYVTDVPASLKEISQTALELKNQAMAFFPNGKKLNCTGDFTWSLWLKPLGNETKRQTLLVHTGSWSLHYLPASNQLEFAVRNGGKNLFQLPENFRNLWHHLLLVRSGDQLRLRVDGTPVGPAQTISASPVPGANLYLGAGTSQGDHAFTGKIDEVGLWSRALSDEEADRLTAGAAVTAIPDPTKLTRTITSPFPAELPVKERPTTVELVRNGKPVAVIALQKGNRHPELARLIQQKLAEAWGVTFPIREIADHSDGNFPLILFGRNNSNMLTRELTANGFLSPNTLGYEVRVFPQVLDWNRGAVFLGGATPEEVGQAVDQLLQRCPRVAPLPFLAVLERQQTYPAPEEFFSKLQNLYNSNSHDKSRAASPILNQLAHAYRDTADERYAKTMGDVISMMLEKYPAIKASQRNHPPTFFFYEIPRHLFLVENSPAFTARHRRDAAELCRQFMEDTIVFYEMANPAVCYAQGQVKYWTNHFNFAARSSYDASRYLLDRHDFTPAQYWQAVAECVFDGVKNNPISPEDAAGYHFLVYRIFTDHALASGRYGVDFFQNARYQGAVDFAKLITNPLGSVPGYGDADALGGASHYTLLRDALDILGDRDCEYLLTLIARQAKNPFYRDTISAMGLSEHLPPPSTSRYLGLNAIALNDFLLDQHRRYPAYPRPVLNKAIFRSGWDNSAEFLALNGLTSAPHGHDDATGICQYIKGDRLWIFEGHYINRHAEDHNVLNVIRNGEAPDRRRNFPTSRNMAAQIVSEAETDAKDFALLNLLLENYNGVDQYRRIAWEKDGGFWLLDQIIARKPGDYLFLNQLRTTGQIREHAQGILVEQKPGEDPAVPHRFSISEDGDSIRNRYSRLERCHGRPNTVLPGYRYSDGVTRSLLYRRTAVLAPGDKQNFFHYLTPLTAGDTPVPLRRVADHARLALTGDFPRLAALGPLNLPGVTIDAESCFIGPRGILAENARKITLGDHDYPVTADAPTVIAFRDEKERADAARILAALPEQPVSSPIAEPVPVVPQQNFTRMLPQQSPVRALAVHDRYAAVGLADGTFKLIDLQGETVAEKKFDQEISAIAFIEAGDRSCWAIGVCGPRTRSIQDVTAGTLHVLSPDGKKELWQKELPFYSRRYGNARTIFRAFLDGQDAAPSIVVGCDSWTYHAFTLDGQPVWQARCVHGATSGAAGDLNGDGWDEVFIGNEYYSHTILDHAGKPLKSATYSPHDVAATILDLNEDGKKEVIVGRYDGFLYIDALQDNPLDGRQLNLGGQPRNIAVLPSGSSARLAAAAFTGVITFIGSDLKPTARLVLPAPVVSMAARGARVYAAAMDGNVYEMEQGKLLTRLPFRYAPDAPEAPPMAAGEQLLVLGSGKNLYFLR